MARPDTNEFMAKWTEAHGYLEFPGALLMKYGPEEYVGATICVRGTLYFTGSHKSEVREAICKCFDAYEAIAKSHLRWLWRDEPPSGPNKFAYVKAPEFRSMVETMDEDDHFGFTFTGGEKAHDASPWLFSTFGRRAWQARMGTKGPDSLKFSVPKEVVEQNPTLFQELFLKFCDLLKVEHGHGGFALNLSPTRREPNEPTEAFMVSKMAGLDAGAAHMIGAWPGKGVDNHLVNVSWLTALSNAMLEEAGGLAALRSELPAVWFAKYAFSNGIVIQAGPQPEIAPIELDPKPATYVLPAMALKEVRLKDTSDLHYGSKDGEPRLTGLAASEWFSRFDVKDDELIGYKAKLLQEPKLTSETSLSGAL